MNANQAGETRQFFLNRRGRGVFAMSRRGNNVSLPMNPKMVERGTSPRPSPHFAPPTPQNAEREKRSQRLVEIVRRMVHWFNARMVRGNLSPGESAGVRFPPKTSRIEPLNQRQSSVAQSPTRGNNFSLSPGERAGVRASVKRSANVRILSFPRLQFMGSPLFHSDLLTAHEPTRTRCGRDAATREQRLPVPGGGPG